MPECPNCREFFLGNPDICYKCNYDFKLKKVISNADRGMSEKERLQKIKDRELLQLERINCINKAKAEQLERNAMYEYEVDIISDLENGAIDYMHLRNSLTTRASEGWRLINAFTNEMGKTTSTVGFGGVAGGINATIDSTILIFERCIKTEDS